MTETPQLFKTNPMYEQLKPETQRRVDAAIQEHLTKIDRNVIFTETEKEEEKKWYLEKGALVFLEDMWNAQNEMKEFSRRVSEKRTAKENGTGQNHE